MPEEPIEIVTAGSYVYRNGRHVIEYDEVFEGMEGKTHNIVSIGDSQAEVHKKGQADVDMIFEKDKTNVTYYSTPFGTIEMMIATTDIHVTEEPDRIGLEIEYALSMNETHVADCSLSLIAESQKPDADYASE